MADTTALTAGAAAVLMLAIGAAATGIVGPSRTDLGAGLTLAQAAPQANARELPSGDPAIAPALPPQPADRGPLSGRAPELQIDANRNSPAPLRPSDTAPPSTPPEASLPTLPRPVIVDQQPATNPPAKPMPLPTPVVTSTTRPTTAGPSKPPVSTPPVVIPTSSATRTDTASTTTPSGRTVTP